MRTHLSAGVVLLTILSFGCGGKMSSPASPSAVSSAAPSGAGATLNGSVRLGATAATGSAADPLTVQIVGTNLLATVTPAGQFTLNGVPSGSVQLHFAGAGANAYVTLTSQVATGETVTVTVTVVGTSAVIESEEHGGGGDAEEQIEGRIESLPPTQAAGTLVVSGRTITTDASTVITQDGATRTFADLAIGQRVHVKGHTSGSTFLATRIEIQNDVTDVPVDVNGIVSNLTGSELSFQFVVNGRQITGDSQTVFFGDGDHMDTFADLKNGVRVEVKGRQQDAAVYAVRIHINGNDSGNGDNNEFDATGPISGLGGTCPALSFTLSGTPIDTDASTKFHGRSCSSLQNGDRVEVKGTKQPSGHVLATKVDQ